MRLGYQLEELGGGRFTGRKWAMVGKMLRGVKPRIKFVLARQALCHGAILVQSLGSHIKKKRT